MNAKLIGWILLAVAGVIGWQWWLERRDPVLLEAERARRDADRAGRAQEGLLYGARPRLADDEIVRQLPGLFEQMDGLWSRIFSDGSFSNRPIHGPLPPVTADPFIFGYGTRN